MILSDLNLLEGTALLLLAGALLLGFIRLTRGLQADSNAPDHLAVLTAATISMEQKAG